MKLINFFLPAVLAASLSISSLIAQTTTDDDNSSQPSDSEEMMILSPSDAGKSMQLAPNQKLCIALPLNPAKGGEWTYSCSSPEVFQLTEWTYDEIIKNSHTKGVKFWIFSPASPGSSTFVFSYQEPWNNQPQVPLVFTVTVP